MNKTQTFNMEQAILEAAEKLFLDKGYAKASTTEIARLVGCNQALVHYYYRSKENLFKQVFENKIKGFLDSLLQISDENLPFEKKLEKRVTSHFEMLKMNRKLPVLLFNEVSTNMDLASKIFADIGHIPLYLVEHMQTELDKEFADGRICKTNAANLLFSIFSLNVMTFMALPVLKLFVDGSDEKVEAVLEQRKAENVRVIMNSLKP